MSKQTRCVEQEMQCKCTVMEKPLKSRMEKPKKLRQERLECEPLRQEPLRKSYEQMRRPSCEPVRRPLEPVRQSDDECSWDSDSLRSSKSRIRNPDVTFVRNHNLSSVRNHERYYETSDSDVEEIPKDDRCNFTCCQTAPRSRIKQRLSSPACSDLSEELGSRLRDCLRQKASGRSSRMREEC